MKEGKTIILQPYNPAYNGFSIARYNGKVVMIRGAIPGETVEARIEEEKRDYYIAKAIKIIYPSPDRVIPKCPYFGICGGCHLQYISHKCQIYLKEKILEDTLKRLANIEIRTSSLFDTNPWEYRYKGQFKVNLNNIGFYKEKSREVVDIKKCCLMTEEVNDFLKKTRDLLSSMDKNLPLIKEIHITSSDQTIGLLKTSGRIENPDDMASKFLNYGFAGIVIYNGREINQYGKEYITLDLEGIKYTVSPFSFFQSHWKLNREVVRFILDNLKPLDDKTVLDLYSGAGNFSLPISKYAREVIAIEENPYAVADGKRNAKINNIINCRFIPSSVERCRFYKPDILLIDPPRAGLTNIVIEKILTLLPEKIVYISCNPSTLARDLKKLILKYEIILVKIIDFFPQTYHIESVCFLKLR